MNVLSRIFVLLLFLNTSVFPASKEVIESRINGIVSRLPATTKAAVLIYNPLTQDTIFSLNPAVSMIPASNTKLFTTSAALSLLGGDYPLSTKLLCTDNNTRDGVINGNLYIKGYGNSVLTEQDITDMVLELKKSGITRITGNIVGDDTYFDNVYTRDDWITDETANVKLPPISAIVVNRNTTIVQKKRGRRTRNYVANVTNPPLHAAALVREKLLNNGIEVLSPAVTGITPEDNFVLAEKVIPLRKLIGLINKKSDNFLAECLFKTIGATASGTQGNAFYSTQAVLDFIDDNGIFAKGTAVVDGSGISRFNQITTGAIAGLLEKMYFDLKNFEDYYNSLSIAGVDGTLRNRMKMTAAENNFHGKTGTLNGVTSIAGYITTKKDEDLVISMIFEYQKGSQYLHKSLEDEIIEVLANWD
jgi:D-alanyl-D-alanine carboxypeptidase